MDKASKRTQRIERVILAILFGLIVGGVAARMQDLGYPEHLTWDEPHFAENARNFLHNRPDWNDHPPLGKLLIAAGMIVVGDNSTGWRLVPLLFGLALIGLAYFLTASAFRSRMAGLFAAAFVAADGFVLAYAKTALIDEMLATMMVAAALSLWRARSWIGIAIGAVFIGLAMSIKFSGAVMAVPLACIIVWRFGRSSKSAGLLALSFLLIVGVYAAQFSFGLALTGSAHGLDDVFRKSVDFLRRHLAATEGKHPQTSRWYTWFIPLKTITLHYAREGDTVRTLSTMGHPVLWWGVNGAVLWSAFDSVRRRREHASATDEKAVPNWGSGQLYLLLLWFLPLLPWIITDRDSYLYHYLPSYVFGLMLLGGVVSTIAGRKAIQLGFVVVVALVFVYCVPVWAKIPFSADSLLHFLFFPHKP